MPTGTRKMCRTSQRCEPRSLAEAVDCVTHHSDLTLREIAERIGKSESYLRTACSQYDDSHHFQADLIVPVSVVTGNAAIVRFLAHAVGGEFVRLPSPMEVPQQDCARAAVAVSEFGQLLEVYAGALMDGQVSLEESQRIDREGHEAIEAILAIMAHARLVAVPHPTARRPSSLREVG